ncbi:Glycosyl hydrolase family 10 [Verrucomicrobiia bacterium DG1235]|nr:Glycosyl hydrolase family 10 [Verrucomicrobiae bacterium DG1235]
MPIRAFSSLLILAAAHIAPAPVAPGPETLRQAANDKLLIGCPVGGIDLSNTLLLDLVLREFNTITIETELMPFKLGADEDDYAFENADRVLEWADAHDLPVYGHMLLWDYRTPQWMFTDPNGTPLPREQGIANLKTYIQKVATHYRGRLAGWNVVNEAISDTPGEYLRETSAYRSIGPDYVQLAFQFAQEADPNVPLYYNDYNLVVPEKREKALRLIRELQAADIRLDAIGMQGHWLLGFPEIQWIHDSINAFAGEGIDIYITELDVDVLPRTVAGANMATVDEGPNPYPDALPEPVQRELAQIYHEFFAAILEHPEVKMITFWGSHDGRSWLNDFPVTGRTNYPLLFDRNLQKKPAHQSVLKAFSK